MKTKRSTGVLVALGLCVVAGLVCLQRGPARSAGKPALLAPIRDVTRPVRDRLKAVQELGKQPLAAAQLHEVLDYLRSPLSLEATEPGIARAVRNDILNVLRESQADPAVIIPALIADARDKNQDAGLRDYDLQHLGAWVPDLPESLQAAAEAALKDALNEREDTYAGTALLALHDLRSRKLLKGEFDLAAACRQIVTTPGYSWASRVSALAVAQEAGLADNSLREAAVRWTTDAAAPETARRVSRLFLKASPAGQAEAKS